MIVAAACGLTRSFSVKRTKTSRGWDVGANRRRGLLAGGVCLAAVPALAQDAWRLATDEQQVYTDLQRSAQEATQRKSDNVRWGPVNAVFGVSLGVGYNDNIFLTSSDREGGLIINPSGNAQVYWDATDNGALALSMGVGYSKYIDHSELDQFTIAPNSVINYSLLIGSVRLRFQDTMSYSLDPTQVGAVSGVAEYGGFQNTIGVAADWELRKAVLTVGYNHYNFVSTADASNAEENASDSVFARMRFELSPAFSLGPEVAVGSTRYVEEVFNDNKNASVGLFVRWDPSDKLSVEAQGGYAYYTFQANGLMPQPPDHGSFYGTLTVNHTINDRISHSLRAGQQVQTGLQAGDSDAVELIFAGYSLSLNIIKDVPLTAGVSYNHGEDIGGFSPEIYQQLTVSAGASYQLTKHLGVGLMYQYVARTSDLPGNDYFQNSVWLTFGYTF